MNIKNVLVAGKYEEQFRKQLPVDIRQKFRFLPIENITVEDLSWADAYVGPAPCQDFQFFNIKWVHTFNAGVNNYLELEGWEENNILLTRTVCSFGQRISEYCLSYVLRELQFHHFFAKKQAEKHWVPKTPKMLKDQTMVIFGTGEIGQIVAKTFNSFGATVYGVSKNGQKKEFFDKNVQVEAASKVVEEADWVTSTLPLTKETKNLFTQQLFNKMNEAYFINVGRGATVDELALIEALNSGRVRMAILDVVTFEPLPETSEL